MDTEVGLHFAFHRENRNEHNQPFRIIKSTTSGSIPRGVGKFCHVKKSSKVISHFSDPFWVEFGSLCWHDETS
jgi:hypothetical protein